MKNRLNATLIISGLPNKDMSKIQHLSEPIDALCAHYGIEMANMGFSSYHHSEMEEVYDIPAYEYKVILSKCLRDPYTYHLLLTLIEALVGLWNSQHKPLQCILDVQIEEWISSERV